MTDLEQWSKRTVGVGEPRIGRDNPRGTGYPQDRKFGLDVTWTLRIYLTSNESMKLNLRRSWIKDTWSVPGVQESLWKRRLGGYQPMEMEDKSWEDSSSWKTRAGRTTVELDLKPWSSRATKPWNQGC